MPSFFGRMASLFGGGGGRPAGEQRDPHLEEFVYFESWNDSPQSSNVTSMQYKGGDEKLTVEYRGAAYYEYHPVTEDEAAEAYRRSSKGGWVWDRLRVRGTACGHRKNYAFLSALSSWHPKRPCPPGELSGPAGPPPAKLPAPGRLFRQMARTLGAPPGTPSAPKSGPVDWLKSLAKRARDAAAAFRGERGRAPRPRRP